MHARAIERGSPAVPRTTGNEDGLPGLCVRASPGNSSPERCVQDTTTWSMLTDVTVPEARRACIFCGVLDSTNRRSLFLQDVSNIIQEQHDKGVVEPVNTCMRNIVRHTKEHFAAVAGEGVAVEAEAIVNTCMCCYHWVARRQFKDFVRFPLQNLFWYTRSLDFHKRRNYDARIIHRLAQAVSSPQGMRGLCNYYATLFSDEELKMLSLVASRPVSELHDLFARHYYIQNGEPLFVPNSKVTEAVRMAVRT